MKDRKAAGIIALAAFLIGWFVPAHFYRDDKIDMAGADAFRSNAIATYAWMNDNPLATGLSRLFVYRLQLTDFRHRAQSCESGTDAALPHWQDMTAKLTARGPFGLPVQRHGIGCAGLSAGVTP